MKSKVDNRKIIHSKQQTAKVVIVNNKGEILILKTLSGKWDLPGGNREHFDKSIRHTAKREIWEETRVKTNGFKLLGNGKIESKLRHLFKAKAQSKTNKITLNPKEHVDFAWVKPKDLESFSPLKPKLRKLLNAHLRQLREANIALPRLSA